MKKHTKRSDYEIATKLIDALARQEYPIKINILSRESGIHSSFNQQDKATVVFKRLQKLGLVEVPEVFKSQRPGPFVLVGTKEEAYAAVKNFAKTYTVKQRPSPKKGVTYDVKPRGRTMVSALGEKSSDIKIEQISHILGQFVEQEVSKATALLYAKYKDIHTKLENTEAGKIYFSDLCKTYDSKIRELEAEVATLRKDDGIMKKLFGN